MTASNEFAPGLQGALRLHDWGLIIATGADSASFLHGQLTQDMLHLPDDRARPAGYCSAKGRLMATFIAWMRGPQELALACSADVLPATLKRLSMFVLRAKCKLTDAGGSLAIYGLAGEAAARWLGDSGGAQPWSVVPRGVAQVIRLPDAQGTARWLLVQPQVEPEPDLPPISAEHWQWLEVVSGVPRITAANVEQFVPQMVNLELTGGVNFQKGCYPGQEVVARSQYRGTLKRRMYRLAADGPISAGDDVFHESDPDQPAGRVVLAAPAPTGGSEALVEFKSALFETPGDIRCGGASLRRLALPYVIPAEPA